MNRWTNMSIAATTCALALLGACGGSDEEVAPVTITVAGPNAVSQWNEIATTTINQPAAATGTPKSRCRPTRSTSRPCRSRSTTR